jgi:hypothetical protein
MECKFHATFNASLQQIIAKLTQTSNQCNTIDSKLTQILWFPSRTQKEQKGRQHLHYRKIPSRVFIFLETHIRQLQAWHPDCFRHKFCHFLGEQSKVTRRKNSEESKNQKLTKNDKRKAGSKQRAIFLIQNKVLLFVTFPAVFLTVSYGIHGL